MRNQEDEHTRVLYQLCSMIIHVLRTPPTPISLPTLVVGVGLSSSSSSSASTFASTPSPPQSDISPAGFAALCIGVSVALMLFGSVTLVIGLLLMPLVIALVFLFYLGGMVSSIAEFGRSVLCSS